MNTGRKGTLRALDDVQMWLDSWWDENDLGLDDPEYLHLCDALNQIAEIVRTAQGGPWCKLTPLPRPFPTTATKSVTWKR